MNRFFRRGALFALLTISLVSCSNKNIVFTAANTSLQSLNTCNSYNGSLFNALLTSNITVQPGMELKYMFQFEDEPWAGQYNTAVLNSTFIEDDHHLKFSLCLLFSTYDYINCRFALEDLSGELSDPIEVHINRPAGAN